MNPDHPGGAGGPGVRRRSEKIHQAPLELPPIKRSGKVGHLFKLILSGFKTLSLCSPAGLQGLPYDQVHFYAILQPYYRVEAPALHCNRQTPSSGGAGAGGWIPGTLCSVRVIITTIKRDFRRFDHESVFIMNNMHSSCSCYEFHVRFYLDMFSSLSSWCVTAWLVLGGGGWGERWMMGHSKRARVLNIRPGPHFVD